MEIDDFRQIVPRQILAVMGMNVLLDFLDNGLGLGGKIPVIQRRMHQILQILLEILDRR
ncbi:hypothetical protein D1872_308160 [compost metagenome]